MMSSIELKKAIKHESIPFDGIESNLWNWFSIPNTSESRNQLFLESIPSPIDSQIR